jgi:enamine deaminase RidA (YjgF/YER057c/UK114 family)
MRSEPGLLNPHYPTAAVLICAGWSSLEYLIEMEAVAHIERAA